MYAAQLGRTSVFDFEPSRKPVRTTIGFECNGPIIRYTFFGSKYYGSAYGLNNTLVMFGSLCPEFHYKPVTSKPISCALKLAKELVPFRHNTKFFDSSVLLYFRFRTVLQMNIRAFIHFSLRLVRLVRYVCMTLNYMR